MLAMCNSFKKSWLNNSVHCKIYEMAGVVWAVSLKSYSKCRYKWKRKKKTAFVYPLLKYWKEGVILFKIVSISKNDFYVFIHTWVIFIYY